MVGSEQKAREILSGARNIVAFTGAGISQESGIPTYRGDGGTWTKYDPDKYASLDYFFENPAYYWGFFREERYPVIQKALPNPGHEALARLEEDGRLSCLITQNIDGLHGCAGSKNVIELHGNTRTIACLSCGRLYSMAEIYAQLEHRDVPECVDCDGMLKTTVVLFGEGLPPGTLEAGIEAAAGCDACLCVGSSLVVYPAAGIPQIALKAGAPLIIVNQDPTPLDGAADVVLRGPAGEILPRII